MANIRRVVITGVGALACNGNNIDEVWSALKNGQHGIAPLTGIPEIEKYTTHFGGQVKLSTQEVAEAAAHTDDERKTARRTSQRKARYTLLALAAAKEAMIMSGLDWNNWKDPFRVGTIVGSGIGGIGTIEEEFVKLTSRGPSRVSPFLVPKMIVDSATGDVSIAYGAKGPNYCVTTACATGSHCLGAAAQHIRLGHTDVMITGGTEAGCTQLGLSGFGSIKALSTRNDDPATASRPFDADRDGFVLGEGAGVLILEELEHAKARGADIIAEVVGYGCTGDAYHETAPDPSGAGGIACMQMALRDAELAPEALGYINAHGTSTKFNDAGETNVIKQVFGDHAKKLAVSSTKSMTGHTLGAAGGIEAIATALSLREGVVPPTINYTTPDPECDLDYVPNEARELTVDYALSNNLGFGGHNASVILKRFTD